jgi:DNA recombination protein RmuC
MIEGLIAFAILLLIAVIVMQVVVLRRPAATDLSPVLLRLDSLEKSHERAERSVKEEIARNRQESTEQGRALREEVQVSLKNSTDSLVQGVDSISGAQQQRLEDFASQLNALTTATDTSASQLRSEVTNGLHVTKESQEKRLSENAAQLQQHIESFGKRLSEFSQTNQESATQIRTELAVVLKDFKDSLQKQMHDMAGLQKQQLDSFATQLVNLTEKNEKKSDELRVTVEGKLTQLQSDNATKLEEMRRTVDEKLQGTLDKRLGESFKQVSDRLELVHKGLGEMQTLASGVGDLKRVLTNVKTRGTWGEMQLGNLLEQILTIDQFARNVRTKPPGGETVEFAIKLPGPDEHDGKVVWLPIDAKFPKESYERLVDAADRADALAVEQAAKELESAVRSQARQICDKYLAPPHTTDFGLLYLPTEGLYAEVLRRPGLLDSLQREQRVVIVGPTTLAALLNSLQMGFRTLAIQKRSSEVWKVLGAVKSEFGKFGDMLDKVKKKLEETGNTIDDAVHRSRQIERRLRKVETLPPEDGIPLLAETQLLDIENEEAGEITE